MIGKPDSVRQVDGREFRIAYVEFNRNLERDKKILKVIEDKGKQLAVKVNSSSANNAQNKRSPQRILTNCVAGVLAEWSWHGLINSVNGKGFVIETPFEDASTQIDLRVSSTGKDIEIRSSFPFNGIQFALSDPNKQFDVIGPYINSIKIGEPSKHFYLRTLYPFHVNDFMKYFYADIVKVYLTGGATWDMMDDDKVYLIKDFVPEDSEVLEKSDYRVIPFSKALDTFQMLNIIKK